MRDIALFLIMAGAVPVSLVQPYIGVLVYSWISYMIPHRLTWGFMHDFPIAFVVGAATAAGWIFARERKSIPMTAATWLLIAFTLWCSFTTVFAVVPIDAREKWIQFIKIMFMTFVTLSILRDRDRVHILVWVIAGSLGFYGLKSGLFTLLSGGQNTVFGPGGMIADNNHFAVAMLMNIPLLRYLQLTTGNKWIRIGLAGAMGLSVLAVVGTYSRGALVGMVVLAAYFWFKSRQKIILGILGAAVLFAAVSFMPDKWFGRMDTIETYEEDASAQGRFDAWNFAVRIAIDKPITAGGFNVFWDHGTFVSYVPTVQRGRAAHSIYFEVLGEHGFIGLALFLAIGFMTLRNGRWIARATRDRPDLARARHLGVMVQVSVVGYAASGAFLTMAFFDLFYHLVAISIINRWLTERELVAAPGESTAAASPSAVGGIPALAGPRVSFLRDTGRAGARRRLFH